MITTTFCIYDNQNDELYTYKVHHLHHCMAGDYLKLRTGAVEVLDVVWTLNGNKQAILVGDLSPEQLLDLSFIPTGRYRTDYRTEGLEAAL